VHKNNIFLLTESQENAIDTPKDDLLCCFSESNLYTKKLDKEDIHNKTYIHSRYVSLKNDVIPAPVFIADSANSSLDIAHQLIQENIFPHFASVLCRNQKAGRGQLRRNWSSPEGNIYAALCLPNIPPFSTEAAAPALGGIIANALNTMGYEVFLKWPNDILQKKPDNTWQKVAGILLEERHDTLVAGIGINLNSAPSKSELRKDSFIEAGVLQTHSPLTRAHLSTTNICTFKNTPKKLLNLNINKPSEIDKTDKNMNDFTEINTNYIKTWDIWLTLVEHIFLWYKKQISKTCNTPWQAITQQYLAFMNETVKIYKPIIKENSYQRNMTTDYIEGRVSGINSNGELLLQSTVGLVTILGGTFSQEDNE